MFLHLKEWVGKETRKLTTRTKYCKNHLQQTTIIDEKESSQMPHKTRTPSSEDNKGVYGFGSHAKSHLRMVQEEKNETWENLVVKNEEGSSNYVQRKLFYGEQSRWDLEQRRYGTEEAVHDATSNQIGGGKPYRLQVRQEHDSSVLATSKSTGGEKPYSSQEEREQDSPAVNIKELCRELGQRETPYKGQNRDQKMSSTKLKEKSQPSPKKKLSTKPEKRKCTEKRKVLKNRLEGDKGKSTTKTLVEHYGQKRVKLRHSCTAQSISKDGPLAYSFISLKLLKADCESFSAVADKFSKIMDVHGTTEIERSRSVSAREEKYENNTGENEVPTFGSMNFIDQVHIESFPFHDQDVDIGYSDSIFKKSVASALKSFPQNEAASNASKNMPLIRGSSHNHCSDAGCSTLCLHSSEKLKFLLKEEGVCAATSIGNFNNKMLEKFGKYLALRRFQLNCAMQEALLHGSKADAGNKNFAKVQAELLQFPVKNERKICTHTLTEGRKPAKRVSEQAFPDDNTPHSITKALQDLTLEDIHDSVLRTGDKAWEKGLAHSFYFKEFFNEIWNADVESSLNNLQIDCTTSVMPETSSGEASSKLHDAISIQAGYKSRLDGPKRDLSPLRVIFEDRNKELLHDLLLSLTEEEQLIKEAWAYNMKQMLDNSQCRKGNTQSDSFIESGKLGNSSTMLKHKDKLHTLHRKFIEGKIRAQGRTDHIKTQLQQFPQENDVSECSKDNADSVHGLGIDTKKVRVSEFQTRSCQDRPLLLGDCKKNNTEITKDLGNRERVLVLLDGANNPAGLPSKQVKQEKGATSTGKAFIRGHDSVSRNKEPKQKVQLFTASSNSREKQSLKIPPSVLPIFFYGEDKNGSRDEESDQCPLARVKQIVEDTPQVAVSENTSFKINNIRNYALQVDKGSKESEQSQMNIDEAQAKSLYLWQSEATTQSNYSLHQQTYAIHEAESQQKFPNDVELYVPDYAIIAPEFSHSEADFVNLQTATDSESGDQQHSDAVAQLIPFKLEGDNGTYFPQATPVLRDRESNKEHNPLDLSRTSLNKRHFLRPDSVFDAYPSLHSPDEQIFLERFYAKDYLYPQSTV